MENEPAITNLPTGWKICSLSDFAEVILGQSPPSSSYNKMMDGLPFFQGKADFGDIYPTPRTWCSAPNKIAEEDDVLISVRAPVGPTNLAPSESCIGRGLAAIRPMGGVDPKFVLFLLRAHEAELADKGTGSTFKAISGALLKQLRISLPPIAEQRRILEKIENITERASLVDTRCMLIQKMKDEFLLSILDEAVDGRLSKTYREFKGFQTKSTLNPAENGGISDESIIYPELPENWSLCSLDELTQMVGSGITPKGGKSSYLDRGVALIRSQNIRIMRLDLSDVAYISENQDEKMARTRVHYGDVLLNITGASIGRVAWFDRLDIPANVNQHVCILRLNSPIQDWVTVCLASGYGQSQIMKMQSGVTREGLNYKQVRRLVIPIPPDDERQFIIRKVNDSLDRVNIIAESVFKSEVLLETLHKSILKQAFEGNLVPQDPNDEPAEKLLARIKGEKNRGNAQSRKSLTRSHFTG